MPTKDSGRVFPIKAWWICLLLSWLSYELHLARSYIIIFPEEKLCGVKSNSKRSVILKVSLQSAPGAQSTRAFLPQTHIFSCFQSYHFECKLNNRSTKFKTANKKQAQEKIPLPIVLWNAVAILQKAVNRREPSPGYKLADCRIDLQLIFHFCII